MQEKEIERIKELKMDKDINDYKYGDLLDDIKLKSFIQHSTPAEIDISAIKKRAFENAPTRA